MKRTQIIKTLKHKSVKFRIMKAVRKQEVCRLHKKMARNRRELPIGKMLVVNQLRGCCLFLNQFEFECA